MSLPSYSWGLGGAPPPKTMPHSEVLAMVARAANDTRFMTLGDRVVKAGLDTVAEFMTLTLEELNGFAEESGFSLSTDATKLRVKLSMAFQHTWLPALPSTSMPSSGAAAPTGGQDGVTSFTTNKRGGSRNTMLSVVPPVEPLPGFDPREVRITPSFYAMFPAVGSAEHLTAQQACLPVVHT
eukprot:6201964-Pleurochrysis_carterae.AAC.1